MAGATKSVFAAALLLSIIGGAHSQLGLLNLVPVFTNLAPGMWSLTLQVTNFNLIVGFDIVLYLNTVGGAGITITNFSEDPGLFQVSSNPAAFQFFAGMPVDLGPPFVPEASTTFEGNRIAGGSIRTINLNGGGPGLVFVPLNCEFIDVNPTVEACSDDPLQNLITIFFTAPSSATEADFIIGGPPDSSPDEPVFAFTGAILPPIDFFDPPPPSPPPSIAAVKSDPHFQGFLGQQFDFNGVAGRIYQLVKDVENGETVMSITSKFDTAYTTGLSTDGDTLSLMNYSPKGTWISELGIQVGGNTIEIFSAESQANTGDDSTTISHGSVIFNGKRITQVGPYWGFDDCSITITNSATYTRIVLESEHLNLTADIVAPPAAWDIAPADVGSFTHINMQIDSISVVDPDGILGETATMRLDNNGNAIMKANNGNGDGLLRYAPEHYEITSLIP